MNLETFKNEFLEMPEYIRDRVRRQLEEEMKTDRSREQEKKRPNWIKRMVVAAAVILALVGVSKISFVANAMDKLMQYITYRFTVTNEDGTKSTVEMKEGYITLSETAPTEPCFMENMKTAQDMLGVTLLESSSMYQYKDCIMYSPDYSEEGELGVVMLKDHFYSVGDLKNVKLYPKSTESDLDMMTYDAGDKYQSPITMQVSIWTGRDTNAEYAEDKMKYASETVNVNMDDVSSEAEIYTIPQLNVDAVLYTVHTDGPIVWGIEDGSIKCTSAFFVYEGVEYIYMGGIEHDTMKEFLNTLK